MQLSCAGSKRRGFTLIELSIVLVIIGLISGGILVGSEIIRTSELNAMNRDVGTYRTALNAFRMKYNAVPGDMKNATQFWGAETACPAPMGSASLDGTCNGNGSRRVEQTNISGAQNNEMYRAWEHLSLAGMIPGDYTGRYAGNLSSTAIVAGQNVPAHSRKGFFLLMYRDPSVASWFAKSGHVIIAYGATAIQSPLTPLDAAALDSKFDDGKPGYGQITQYTNTVQGGCITSDDATTALYDLSNQNQRCQSHFWMD